MKIENTGPVRPTQNTPRSRGNTGVKSNEFANQVAQTNTPTTSQTSAAMGLESLWFLQEISDQDEKRRQAYRRGKSLLESLEQLRIDILSGTMPASRLLQLRTLLSEGKLAIDDPQLLEIIEEIEVRAWVELAKLETQEL